MSNSGGSELKLVNRGIDGDRNTLKLNGVVVSNAGGGVTNKSGGKLNPCGGNCGLTSESSG